MKLTGRVEVETVTDVVSDVCRGSTRLDTGESQFRTLQARWSYGTARNGGRSELHRLTCIMRLSES